MTNTPNLLYLTKFHTVDLNKVHEGQTYPNKAAFCSQLGINYQNAAHMKKIKEYIKIEKTGNGCEIKIASIKKGSIIPPERKICHKPYKDIVVSQEVLEKPFHYIKRGDKFSNMRELLATIGLSDSHCNRNLVKQHITYKKIGNAIHITNVYDKDRLLDGFKQDSNSFIFYKELIRFLGRGDNLNKAYTIEEIRNECFNPYYIFESKEWKKYEQEHPEDLISLNKLKKEIITYSFHYVYVTLDYLERERKKLNWMEEIYGVEANSSETKLPIYLANEIHATSQRLLKKYNINTYNTGYYFSKEYKEYLNELSTFLKKKYNIIKIKKKRIFMFETTRHLPRIPPFDSGLWIKKIVLTKFNKNPLITRIFYKKL